MEGFENLRAFGCSASTVALTSLSDMDLAMGWYIFLFVDDSNLSRATGEYDAQMRLVEAGEEKNGEGRKGASRQGGGSGDGTATSSGP